MDLSIRIRVIPIGEICGDGAETRCDGAGSPGKDDGEIPGNVYLPALPNLHGLHEKEGGKIVLFHRKNVMHHNKKGLHLPKLSGHVNDGAEVWVLLHDRSGKQHRNM